MNLRMISSKIVWLFPTESAHVLAVAQIDGFETFMTNTCPKDGRPKPFSEPWSSGLL